jgi:phosphonate C-P lyase system protein PhnH
MSAAPVRETLFDPLLTGAVVVRRLRDAAARPGTRLAVGDVALTVEPRRLRPACALLLAVLDADVTLRVVGPHADEIGEYLRFNSGSRSARIEEADFVLVTGPHSGGAVSRAKRGRREGPDAGATIVYAPEALLSAGTAPGDVVLRVASLAPPAVQTLTVRGVAAEELQRLAALAEPPRGVDAWLAAADGAIVVLPRAAAWDVRLPEALAPAC